MKLIYSTVYHLTYVFAPITAVLFFFPVTRGAISGTIQSSLWCMMMPIVLVSILAIVGNSIQTPAQDGNLAIVSIDHILWLFGVTLLLLMSPVLTIGILRGGGVALSGSAIGMMMTNSAMKVLKAAPLMAGGIKATSESASKIGSKALFEPSVRELLKKEKMNSPANEKLKQLDKKGGIRNPFKGQKGIDERLSKIGISKDQAISLSRIPVSSPTKSKGGFGNSKMPSSNKSHSTQSPEKFFYDKASMNNITPEYQEDIRVKHRIKNEISTPNKRHHPVNPSERRNTHNNSKEFKASSVQATPKPRKESQLPQRNHKHGARNEV